MKTKQKPKISKAEMRVVIAKDALAQVRAEKFLAIQGSYVEDLQRQICEYDREEGDEFAELVNGKEQLQPLLRKAKACKVCAKGALFLSAVRKYNKATVMDLEEINMVVAEKIFGERQFDLIEAAFEGWYHLKITGEYVPLAGAFGEANQDDTERLIAILKNIIKNNGTFKP